MEFVFHTEREKGGAGEHGGVYTELVERSVKATDLNIKNIVYRVVTTSYYWL